MMEANWEGRCQLLGLRGEGFRVPECHTHLHAKVLLGEYCGAVRKDVIASVWIDLVGVPLLDHHCQLVQPRGLNGRCRTRQCHPKANSCLATNGGTLAHLPSFGPHLKQASTDPCLSAMLQTWPGKDTCVDC